MIGKNTMITPVKTLVDDAKRVITSISVDDAIARHTDAKDVFIDIRDIRGQHILAFKMVVQRTAHHSSFCKEGSHRA